MEALRSLATPPQLPPPRLSLLFLNQLGGKDMFGGWTAKNALFSKEEAAKRDAKEAAKLA